MKRELDATRGSTLPDPRPGGEAPELATFERAGERFELGAELGRGGMGRVLEATDVSLARTVAIKQVLSDRPDDLVRFEREVRITAQLEHPSIVPIYEAARDEHGRPYYVMRRIEGEPLLARLANADLRTRLALLPNLLAVVDAAAFAHARGIIHRDIKPSNILLGAYGETHLIDWGLARHLDDLDVSAPRAPTTEPLTQAGHVYGTVAYMAPEQARGEPVDARADVFALGATLFHVLAGRAPFAHLSDVERLATVIEGEERLQPELLAEIPRELRAIVEKAMAFSPRERYAHAGELAADLRAYLAGQLVGAHHYTTGQRLRRFVRKHRFALILTAISLLTIAIILIAAISRVLDDRDRAEIASREAIDRAELLLIERASSLAPSEPTRAAAMLLELPLTTRHHERARDVIARIAAYGPYKGASRHTAQVNALAFAPDGTALASVGLDGRLVIYDVATGRSKTAFELRQPLNGVDWLDRQTVLVVGVGLSGGRMIDVVTGAARTFAEGELTRWWWAGDRVRYLDRPRGMILEVPRHGGKPRILASDVLDADGAGEIALVSARTGVLLLDRAELRRLGDPLDAVALAIAFDQRRVALATRTETFEWDVATTGLVDRWSTGSLFKLTYGANQLVLTNNADQLTLLHPGGRITQRPIKQQPIWQRRIASGLVLATEEGTVHVLDALGLHTLDHIHNGTRVLAALPDRMLVALGSRDGSVRWLDLEHVTPRPISLPSEATVCAGTARALYTLVGMDKIAEIDLETGARRDLVGTRRDPGVSMICSAFGDRIFGSSPVALTMIDTRRRSFQSIRDAWFPLSDGTRGAYAVGSKVYEASEPPRLLYSAPSTVEGLALLGDTLLIVLQGKVLRLDLASQEVIALTTPRLTEFGIFADGSLWLGDRKRLWHLDHRGLYPLAPSFDHNIRSVFAMGSDRLALHLVDGSIWEVVEGRAQLLLQPGVRKLAIYPNGLALTWSSKHLTSHYLRSTELIQRDVQTVTHAIPLVDERGVIAQIRDAAIVYRDPVPSGYAEAHAWLEAATNARIHAGATSWGEAVP